MDLSKYQIVRQEFVTGSDDVIATFNKGRFYINSFGLKQFPDKDYIQILVDENAKTMVVKPSVTKKRDSFLWSAGIEKRKPRRINCIPLFYLIFKMMQWDINARYQIKGTIEDYGEEEVIFFDLRDAICFVKLNSLGEPVEDPKYQMQLPQEWEKSYGMPVMEYENRQDIKTFDELAVFDVEFEMKEKKGSEKDGE